MNATVMHRRAVSNIESLVEQVADQWRAVGKSSNERVTITQEEISQRPSFQATVDEKML